MSSRPRSPPPLEDDDLLSEMLLRLAPQPSSLPRASAVCKRWLSLVSDPRFRLHHRRNPPLIGFFDDFDFVPTMDPPNRVPEGCISLQLEDDDGGYMHFVSLGCHNGLVLFVHASLRHVLVWDPVNRMKNLLAVPLWFTAKRTIPVSGAVLRAAGGIQHFHVVLVGTETNEQHTRAIAHVYSSETGVWGDLISRTLPSKASTNQLTTIIDMSLPSVLVGNSLYWLLSERPFLSDSPPGFLELDLDRQRLDVIPVPVDIYSNCQFSVMRADGGGLGFLFMSQSDFIAQLWKRKTNCDGVASWVLERTIELDKLLSLNSVKERWPVMILGYAEDNNVVLLHTIIGLFTVHLESL